MEAVANRIEYDKKFTLIPISDIHLGANATSDKKFRKLVKWIISKPDTYAIVIGDVVDSILRHALTRFSGKGPNKEIMANLDGALNTYRDLGVNALRPLADAGRLLGIGRGNHEEALMTHHSYDITSDMCKELNVPNLGYSFLYRLTLHKRGRDATKNVTIYGHHGFGSSRVTGGAVTKREKLAASFDADIYIMGHDHHKFGTRQVRMAITQKGAPKLVYKPSIVVATGSFLIGSSNKA